MKVEELSLVSYITSYIQRTVRPMFDSIKHDVVEAFLNLIGELERTDSVLEAREILWKYYKKLLQLYGNRKTYLTGLLWGLIITLDGIWAAMGEKEMKTRNKGVEDIKSIISDIAEDPASSILSFEVEVDDACVKGCYFVSIDFEIPLQMWDIAFLYERLTEKYSVPFAWIDVDLKNERFKASIEVREK